MFIMSNALKRPQTLLVFHSNQYGCPVLPPLSYLGHYESVRKLSPNKTLIPELMVRDTQKVTHSFQLNNK